ncbi:serine hydrolase domain-containing protein [Nonomuraea rhodomycinica]|nr:serine hydrolase domain-containing protein [Nonomuraea rhodomycinica]
MRTTAWTSAIAAGLAAVAAAVIMPVSPSPSGQSTGDAALARAVRQVASPWAGHAGLSVALIADGVTRTAGIGADRLPEGRPVGLRTLFEFGSVTKAMTAMLFADMVEKGEVRPQTTLASLLPELRGSAVAATSLEELAQHRSGIPGVAPSLGVPALLGSLVGGNPYGGQSATDVVADAVRAVPAGKGEISYSNHGFALLGQALAARAGTTYGALLRDRLLGPLGMRDTVLIGDAAALPADRARGYLTSGQEARPWSSEGYAPAGAGGWTTAEDLARFVSALLEGTAPGMSATTPRRQIAPGDQIGYGWRVTDGITWHNGDTGGFSSYVGFDAKARRGVVVLGNTSAPVDSIGLALLGADAPTPGQQLVFELPAIALSVLGLLAVARTVEVATRRGRRRLLPPPDRLKLLTMTWRAMVLLALLLPLGAWNVLWPALWPAAAALLAAGVTAGLLRAPRLPLAREPRRGRWVTSAASLLLWSVVAAALAVAWAVR